MKEDNMEDSPYYIEYTGDKTKNIQFKHSKSFKDALIKHLKDKFHTDNFGQSLRTIVEDYLQHQCLEQKLFQKTIVCIGKEDALNNGVAMNVLFVKDEYTQFYQNQVDKGITNGVMFIQVHKSTIPEYVDTNLLPKKEYEILKLASNQYTKSDKPIICEIALNNWLDSYDDGVYGLKSDKSLHLGVNILNTPKKAYGIIYRWGFVTDGHGNTFVKLYGADIDNYDKIMCFDKDMVLGELSKFNKHQYRAFKHMFESHELAFPQNAFERLQKQYERKLKEKQDIDAELERMRIKLENFGYLD